jgi:hypothetical protein
MKRTIDSRDRNSWHRAVLGVGLSIQRERTLGLHSSDWNGILLLPDGPCGLSTPAFNICVALVHQKNCRTCSL